MKTQRDLSNPNIFPGYYIPPPIKEMFDTAKIRVLEEDWDRVYLIDGSEGSGKSLFGLQMGYYLDKTLNLSRITFSGREFSKAIDNATKGQCVIFDEAFNGLSSSGATSKLNRLVVRKLMECRQKNLFVVVILPTIFMLQKYAALFRSKCLFHVYTPASGRRGYYRVYNTLNKKILYLTGKKLYTYAKPFINKSYRFYGKYPINEQDYRAKKIKAMQDSEEEEKVDKYMNRFRILVVWLHEDLKMSYVEIANRLKEHKDPLNESWISRIARKTRENDLILPA